MERGSDDLLHRRSTDSTLGVLDLHRPLVREHIDTTVSTCGRHCHLTAPDGSQPRGGVLFDLLPVTPDAAAI